MILYHVTLDSSDWKKIIIIIIYGLAFVKDLNLVDLGKYLLFYFQEVADIVEEEESEEEEDEENEVWLYIIFQEPFLVTCNGFASFVWCIYWSYLEWTPLVSRKGRAPRE